MLQEWKLSKVERERLARYRARTAQVDERFEPRHPNQQGNSRRAMRNLVRYRNKKATGRYGG